MSACAELLDVLRVGRTRRGSVTFMMTANKPFRFRQLAGDPWSVGPDDPFTLTYVVGSNKFKRNMRDAFKNVHRRKSELPAPECTADMAFCEEDQGLYIWNGTEWRVVGFRENV